MANVKFVNNASTKLASALTSSGTTCTVLQGTGAQFPTLGANEFFVGVLVDPVGNLEVVNVTAQDTDTFTITRAQEGTVALDFPRNSFFENRLTAGSLTALQSQITGVDNWVKEEITAIPGLIETATTAAEEAEASAIIAAAAVETTEDYMSSASSSATSALASAGLASGYADTARTEAQSASTSEAAAAASATAAEASDASAQYWAEQAENITTAGLPAASATTLGGVKIGPGVSVTDTGVISVVEIGTATSSTAGTIKPSTSVLVDVDGTATVPVATVSHAGIAQLASADDIIAGTDTSKIVTPKNLSDKVSAELAGLVNSAPEALDTLNELAAALGDDPSFATTVAAQIGTVATAATAAQATANTAVTDAATAQDAADAAQADATQAISDAADAQETADAIATTDSLGRVSVNGGLSITDAGALSISMDVQDVLDNASALLDDVSINAAPLSVVRSNSSGKVEVGYLPVLSGATSTDNGSPGLVPQPEVGDEDKVLHGNGEWEYTSAIPVGLVACVATSTIPAGWLRYGTGTTLTGCDDAYPDFYTYVADSDNTCTLSAYAATLALTGQCGKFGIDEDTGTVRMPTVKFVQNALGADEIGTVNEAGLPNITGSFVVRRAQMSDAINIMSGLNGVFSSTFDLSTAATRIGMSSGNLGNNQIVSFSGADSNALYGNSTTVQPDSVSHYYIIYAYNAAVSASVAQAAEFTQLLDGKADTTLASETQAGLAQRATSAEAKNFIAESPNATKYLTPATLKDCLVTAFTWEGIVNKIPYIRDAGVCEIGRYLDFHTTGSSVDYDIRLDCESANVLNLTGGSLEVEGIPVYPTTMWKSETGNKWYCKFSNGFIMQGGNQSTVNSTITFGTPFTTTQYATNVGFTITSVADQTVSRHTTNMVTGHNTDFPNIWTDCWLAFGY